MQINRYTFKTKYVQDRYVIKLNIVKMLKKYNYKCTQKRIH